MANFIHRYLISGLDTFLKYSRILNLVGPRQVGKTTLVRDLLQKGQYISLDNKETLETIENDPYGSLLSLSQNSKNLPIIIDEAQNSPKLPLALKRIVDTDRIKGQFLLTGSSNIFRTSNVTDSLAGRVMTLTLDPLMSAEIFSSAVPRIIDWAFDDNSSIADIRCKQSAKTDVVDLVLKGGFPEIRELPIKERQIAYSNHINLIVDRDLDVILKVRKPDGFRRLINQMAIRTGNETSITSLSKTLNLSRETVDLYIDVMIRLSILVRLDAWASGEHHREIKNPKYHFVDSGIVCSLRNFDTGSFDIGQNPTAFGPILESYVVNEFLRALPFQQRNYRAYHWRSPDHREIDLIIERDRDVLGIEVKSASDFDGNDLSHLRWFAKKGPGKNRRFTGILIYLGNRAWPLGDNIYAIPISALWS